MLEAGGPPPQEGGGAPPADRPPAGSLMGRGSGVESGRALGGKLTIFSHKSRKRAQRLRMRMHTWTYMHAQRVRCALLLWATGGFSPTNHPPRGTRKDA